MRYVMHDPATGEIAQAGFCPNAEHLPDLPGLLALPVDDEDAGAATGHVVDGAFVRYLGYQAAAKRQRPTYPARWDNAAMAWHDLRDLEQVKAEHWAAMKAARDAFEFGGFTWDGSTFDSDPASQSRIQGAAQLATLAGFSGQPFSIDWTLATNAVRTLSGPDMLAVGMAMGQHIAAAHAIGRTVRQAVEAAATRAQVLEVAWPA